MPPRSFPFANSTWFGPHSSSAAWRPTSLTSSATPTTGALDITSPALLEFTLPAALIALWMFHNVIKRPVVWLASCGYAGTPARTRWEPFRSADSDVSLAILASIVMGVATHLIWDSFTHDNTWVYAPRPMACAARVYVPFVGYMPIHSALQYGSSIAGLLALAHLGVALVLEDSGQRKRGRSRIRNLASRWRLPCLLWRELWDLSALWSSSGCPRSAPTPTAFC